MSECVENCLVDEPSGEAAKPHITDSQSTGAVEMAKLIIVRFIISPTGRYVA